MLDNLDVKSEWRLAKDKLKDMCNSGSSIQGVSGFKDPNLEALFRSSLNSKVCKDKRQEIFNAYLWLSIGILVASAPQLFGTNTHMYHWMSFIVRTVIVGLLAHSKTTSENMRSVSSIAERIHWCACANAIAENFIPATTTSLSMLSFSVLTVQGGIVSPTWLTQVGWNLALLISIYAPWVLDAEACRAQGRDETSMSDLCFVTAFGFIANIMHAVVFHFHRRDEWAARRRLAPRRLKRRTPSFDLHCP
mmetsp:Transcript_33026/g.67085  ORF Transcript_33026/g.67085 Transcript_33026/m.67085 type:complete len:249 (-) Transcript_33026:376-1122(-)